jgi:hypothetical protein
VHVLLPANHQLLQARQQLLARVLERDTQSTSHSLAMQDTTACQLYGSG